MRTIDADALREAVESHVTSVSVCATAEQARGRTDFKKLCLKDIDEAPTVGAWVSVKDGMPEEHKLVLATDETFYVHVNWIVESKWIRPFHNRITYWMTIPNLPKEGDDDATD